MTVFISPLEDQPVATFRNTHPQFPDHLVRRCVSWIAKQLGATTRGLTIIVGPKQRAHRGYSGWYRHRLLQVEAYVGEQIAYPICVGHNRHEAGWTAAEPAELLVYLLAHELTHAAAYREAFPDRQRLRFLNHEPRVRSSGYRVMLAFRKDRDRLLAAWNAAPTPRPVVPVPSAAEMRAARAARLLAQWERRLKLATTKVRKYRQRAARLERAAATKGVAR